MDHNGEVWAAVAVALINMIGSVAMAFIRGKYDVPNGNASAIILKEKRSVEK